MIDPDKIIFSNYVMPSDEFFASGEVVPFEGLKALGKSVGHVALAILRLLVSPFQQTLQFTAYEFCSAYRNAELAFGIALATCGQPYGEYIMYVANTNIEQYDFFLEQFLEARETYRFLSQPLS